MRKKRGLIIGIAVVILLIGIIFSFYFSEFFSSKENSKFFLSEEKIEFDADKVLLKLAIKEGEFISKTLKITNRGSVKANFEVKEDLDFISVSENEFSLNSEEAKTLELDFNIEDKNAGVYLGELLVLSNENVLVIPVILEIETKEVLFDSNINVFPEYSNVYAGEKLIVENQIFNLEDIGLKTVEITYIVMDFKGKTIFLEQENMVVETQPLTTKIIPLPADIETGNYVFMTIVKYSDSVGTSSYFFKIIDKKTLCEFDDFFMWVVIFFLFGLIFFIIYYVRQRDKMFLELDRQYKGELRRQRELIAYKKKKDYGRLRTVAEKREYKKELGKVRRQRLKAIKEIHETRLKQIRKIKKQGKRGLLKKQLEKWKQKGYEAGYLEAKYKFPKIEEIRSRLRQQLGALEEAHSEGYVSKESYRKGRKRIRREGRKLR